MAEKKKLSVQEMLALARKQGAGGGAGGESSTEAAAAPSPPAASAAAPESASAEAAPENTPTEESSAAPPPAAKPKAGGARMSVAEMLAAARAGGAQKAEAAKPAAEPAAEKKAPPPKPKAADKTSDDKPAEKQKPAAAAGPKNTASILAAARGAAKPGPMTKAEAAAKEKSEPVAKSAKPSVPPMPAKPDYAKPKPAATKGGAEGESRRGFLSLMFGSMMAVGYTSLAAVGGLWTLGMARFMFPNILTEPPSKFKVGFPGDFAPGKVEEKFKAQFGVWIVNTEYSGQPQIFALRTVCTHLGCTPNWLEAEQKFKCPCHGSGFYKDGINFEGPAPRPLERYAISLSDDGQLEVDKSKMFFEEMGQWSDSSSFYTA